MKFKHEGKFFPSSCTCETYHPYLLFPLHSAILEEAERILEGSSQLQIVFTRICEGRRIQSVGSSWLGACHAQTVSSKRGNWIIGQVWHFAGCPQDCIS